MLYLRGKGEGKWKKKPRMLCLLVLGEGSELLLWGEGEWGERERVKGAHFVHLCKEKGRGGESTIQAERKKRGSSKYRGGGTILLSSIQKEKPPRLHLFLSAERARGKKKRIKKRNYVFVLFGEKKRVSHQLPWNGKKIGAGGEVYSSLKRGGKKKEKEGVYSSVSGIG